MTNVRLISIMFICLICSFNNIYFCEEIEFVIIESSNTPMGVDIISIFNLFALGLISIITLFVMQCKKDTGKLNSSFYIIRSILLFIFFISISIFTRSGIVCNYFAIFDQYSMIFGFMSIVSIFLFHRFRVYVSFEN